MSSDDMHVIMCKVLRYLYDCMKKGVEPDATEVSHSALGIPYGYWDSVMRQLMSHGYVSGIADTKTGLVMISPSVTLEGVEFMQESSSMRKALAFLKEARAFIPA